MLLHYYASTHTHTHPFTQPTTPPAGIATPCTHTRPSTHPSSSPSPPLPRTYLLPRLTPTPTPVFTTTRGGSDRLGRAACNNPRGPNPLLPPASIAGGRRVNQISASNGTTRLASPPPSSPRAWCGAVTCPVLDVQRAHAHTRSRSRTIGCGAVACIKPRLAQGTCADATTGLQQQACPKPHCESTSPVADSRAWNGSMSLHLQPRAKIIPRQMRRQFPAAHAPRLPRPLLHPIHAHLDHMAVLYILLLLA